jgi:putative ABC transport system permease protein
MIRAYQLSLTFLSFISLFVGMFLVYSLVALNAAARRRELAVMRATGASGRTAFFLFVGEGAFIGLCGWLLALPISSLLVKYLLAGVSRTVSVLFVRVQVDGLTLRPLGNPALLRRHPGRGGAGGPAAGPRGHARAAARSAGHRPHRQYPAAADSRMALGGIGLLALVYPIARLPSPPSVSLPGYLAALLLFVGFALLAPLMLQQFGRLMAPRLLRLGGQPAFLAAGYLKESGVQTAISVGALITAVALFTALVVMIHSFRSTVALWVQQSIAGDIYVRPNWPNSTASGTPCPPGSWQRSDAAGARGTGAHASPGIAASTATSTFSRPWITPPMPAAADLSGWAATPADRSRPDRRQGAWRYRRSSPTAPV